LNSEQDSQTITKECYESNHKQPIGYHFRDYLYLGDRINRNVSRQINMKRSAIMFKPKFTSLEEMYQSTEYEQFTDARLENDLYIDNPNRARRIAEYAENGLDGSTHGEVISDWLTYLDSVKAYDPDWHEPEEIEKCDITEEIRDSVRKEIYECYEFWRKKDGLDKIIGD
jgi:hypothetical protein